MSSNRNGLSPLLLFLSLTSCVITESATSIQIEIMKPGIFIIPEDLDTVAIFKRDIYETDTLVVNYFDGKKVINDTTIKYSDLSNTCVDGLANFFEEEGYFRKVINYRDSLNYLLKGPQSTDNPTDLFERTKSDICIFLDMFHFFNQTTLYDYNYPFRTRAVLLWTISFKNDTVSYIYNQVDTLFFDEIQFRNFRLKNQLSKEQYKNSSEYLGRFFGTKIIPTWISVERLYYTSRNPDMLKAEKYALSNDWLKAAEIWKRETKNKNKRIAAKACFNMALACEMEGKPDVAIDWLVRSYSGLTRNNEDHKINCQRYVNILAMRKREIERLDKQVRN